MALFRHARVTLDIEEGGAPLAVPLPLNGGGGGGGDDDGMGFAGDRGIKAVQMLGVHAVDAAGAGGRPTGTVQGCPVVFETARIYFGIEHPMSDVTCKVHWHIDES